MPGKIHLAAQDAKDNVEKIKQLVEQEKNDPSLSDENDVTPLEYAAKIGNFAIIRYLVEEAKVTIDASRRPSLLELVAPQSVDVRYYLVNHFLKKEIISELAAAVYLGHMEKVHIILSKSPQRITEIDSQGRTLFFWASLLSNQYDKSRMKCLMKHKAFKNLNDDSRNELWRSAAAASMSKGEPDIAYHQLLEITELSDDDKRKLSEYRYELVDIIRPSNNLQNKPKAYRQQEIFYDFAIANWEEIGDKKEEDYYNLARYLAGRLKIYLSLNKTNEAEKDILVALRIMGTLKAIDCYPEYDSLLFTFHKQLGDCYRRQQKQAQAQLNYKAALDNARKLSFFEVRKKLSDINQVKNQLALVSDKKATVQPVDMKYPLVPEKDRQIKEQEARISLCELEIKNGNSVQLDKSIKAYLHPMDDEVKRRLLKAVLKQESLSNDLKANLITTIVTKEQEIPLGFPQIVWWSAKDPGQARQHWQAEIEYKDALIKSFPELGLDYISKSLNSKQDQKSLDVMLAIEQRSCVELDTHLKTQLRGFYDRCALTFYGAKQQKYSDVTKEALNTAMMACHEKAATFGSQVGSVFTADSCADMIKSLRYYQFGHRERYKEVLNECLENYKKVIRSGDVEELYILLDDKNYPINELGQALLDFILNDLSFSTRTPYEMFFALASRGLQCPEDHPLQAEFKQIQTAHNSEAFVLGGITRSDKGPVKLMTDYLGIQMRGNHSLFWCKQQPVASDSKSANQKATLKNLASS